MQRETAPRLTVYVQCYVYPSHIMNLQLYANNETNTSFKYKVKGKFNSFNQYSTLYKHRSKVWYDLTKETQMAYYTKLLVNSRGKCVNHLAYFGNIFTKHVFRSEKSVK